MQGEERSSEFVSGGQGRTHLQGDMCVDGDLRERARRRPTGVPKPSHSALANGCHLSYWF